MADLPWLRLYTDMVDNEKIRLLAFEDRWHFVAILCCKQQGVLKNKDKLLERKLAVKLGLQLRELDEVKRRLMEVGLIDDEWEPNGWNEHQCKSDSSTERTRKYRENKRNNTGNVTTPSQERHCDAIDIDKEEDKEEEKEGDKEIEEYIIAFPTNKKNEFHFVTTPDFNEYKELYQSVDVSQELKKMLGWLNANPTKRKTKNGMKRFVNGWLCREQDKGGNIVFPQSKADAINARNKAVLDEWLAEQGEIHVSH